MDAALIHSRGGVIPDEVGRLWATAAGKGDN